MLALVGGLRRGGDVCLGAGADLPRAGAIADDGRGRNSSGGLEDVVRPLFARYMLPFEVTALLLLVAMVGVVLLSKKDVK